MVLSTVHLQGLPYVPGRVRGPLRWGAEGDTRGAIAVLRPSELARFQGLASGLIIIDGAPLAHTTIAVRSLGIPTILVQARQLAGLSAELLVTLDGAAGSIDCDAPLTELPPQESPLPPVPGKPLATADGEPVWLHASVRDASAARNAMAMGAAGIGLVRSEFLLPESGKCPDSGFYRHAIEQICQAAQGLPVVIRLLDISPDKRPDWLPPLAEAESPLGLQGARLFDKPLVREAVLAQIEAIGNLSDQYDLRLLIPYLSRYEELCEQAEQVRRHLPHRLPLGAMLETPAAALDIANWLDVVDFVAVGCNDLMQCLFGADRDQQALAPYLDPYAPVLFRLFRQITEAAAGNMQRIQLCGLLTQFPGVMPVLLGLGYRIFSVDGVMIPYLARVIEATSTASARRLAQGVCAANRSREVKELMMLPD